ncbi:MAG: circadian clock protein KaiC [archaeon ADurb.Bin336]|nr:MAG: circadian clock protein KaiC [archaeon ADurb.Bin336]
MAEDIIRTKTGIQGLDRALNGGIPSGNMVLVSGGAGTGKSTFCLEFIVNGANTFGEKGLYLSTEQNKDELYKQASLFNWNLLELEQKGLVKIIYYDPTSGDGFPQTFNDTVTQFKPKRIVVDSLTTLLDSLLISGISDEKGFSLVQIAETINPIPRTEQIVTKHVLYSLFKVLKAFKITTLLTTEMPENGKTLSADGVSEFVADGVIILQYVGVGSVDFRSMTVRKMRYTDHSKSTLAYAIEPSGISIKESEI